MKQTYLFIDEYPAIFFFVIVNIFFYTAFVSNSVPGPKESHLAELKVINTLY